jgi:hypothetical protein
MTKLLDQAIIAVRSLSEADQDAAAGALFAHLAADHRQFGLTAEQVEDVKRTQQALREAGKASLAMRRWKRSGASAGCDHRRVGR